MNTLEAVIEYEKQHDLKSSRTCGAACLSMVYRSFGKKIAQDEIWPAIAKPNRFGSLSSTTHLMTRDALKRGIAAVAIQARSPLQALKGCRDKGICAILNHRLSDDVATGHYSVLIDLDDRNVVLHDPLYGPARRLLHSELLQIWKPPLRVVQHSFPFSSRMPDMQGIDLPAASSDSGMFVGRLRRAPLGAHLLSRMRPPVVGGA
jgi:ABC-type bacteriocin/lantibiotic exporter with double-glycine peptidase domain